MEYYYTDERNVQIVISLLKQHGIHRVIASPGTTNISLIASMMHDNFFDIYSAADERSAGYMACGMAAESGEPVVISCTGATASRNYMPALTEAFYRKLPILAITSSRRNYRIGHNMDQVTDRTVLPNDVAKLSVQVGMVTDLESEWGCVIAANKAMLELTHRGNGPVHINLETNYSRNYNVHELPVARCIKRYFPADELPDLKADKVTILVGAHTVFSNRLEAAVDAFCERYNAIVLCDHTSNYKGKYRAFANLQGAQTYYKSVVRKSNVMIYIGDIFAPAYIYEPETVWRVNPDGELRDTFRKLKNVFEMNEEVFFEAYVAKCEKTRANTFYEEYLVEKQIIEENMEEVENGLPFSNAWVASRLARVLPQNSVLHLGILNSLRFWNYFELPKDVYGFSNVGGFGIDGSMSTVIGASLASPDKLFYCVLGDLAFFYDMNSLGNRHVGNNVRILLVNNGKGTEFKLSGNPGSMFGQETDRYIAAAGHYGNKSSELVKHYAQDLGFDYITADSKEAFEKVYSKFIDPKPCQKPMLFEIFTQSEDEDTSLTKLNSILKDDVMVAKDKISQIIGPRGTSIIKKILNKN